VCVCTWGLMVIVMYCKNVFLVALLLSYWHCKLLYYLITCIAVYIIIELLMLQNTLLLYYWCCLN